jgi:hypothetical protein
MIFLLVVLVYGQTKASTNPSMFARPKEGNTVGSSEVKKNNIEGFHCDVLGHEHLRPCLDARIGDARITVEHCSNFVFIC